MPVPPKVIDGEIVDEGEERTVPASPPGPSPSAGRRGRVRWYWWLVGAVVAAVMLCVGLPTAVVTAWFVHATIEAGKGWPTPDGALQQFVDSFSDDTHNGELTATEAFVSGREGPALAARRAFLATKTADEHKHPEITSGRLDIASAPAGAPPESQSVHGDTADLVRYYRISWGLTSPSMGTPMLDSAGLAWTAVAQHQRDGWRLVSVTVPFWCAPTTAVTDTEGYAGCR